MQVILFEWRTLCLDNELCILYNLPSKILLRSLWFFIDLKRGHGKSATYSWKHQITVFYSFSYSFTFKPQPVANLKHESKDYFTNFYIRWFYESNVHDEILSHVWYWSYFFFLRYFFAFFWTSFEKLCKFRIP